MMIRIKNLKLEFPRRFKLSIDELYVEKGRTLAILGPNGAGKSTLLNIIALLQKPDSGSMEFSLGLNNKLRVRRKMSVVFPCPYLLNDTVYENVALPLRIRALYNAEKIKETLSFFKIMDLKDYSANTLSQGQMRRVALARALVTEPELLLLDEPFLSLDRCYKAALCGDLRDILKYRRTTTLLVTQDHSEALCLADKVAVMKDGRILRQGAPREIFTNPASKDMAEFVTGQLSVAAAPQW